MTRAIGSLLIQLLQATSTIRRQGFLRNRWDARRLEMKNAQLELSPLHS